MDFQIPDIDSLLKSPPRGEEDIEENQDSPLSGPYEAIAKKTAGALHRIRATLAKAKVNKNNRKGVLDPTISLIAALNEQAAEIATLKAKVSLLETETSKVTDLKAQMAYLKAENEKLKQEDTTKSTEIASLTEQNVLLKAENTMLAQRIAQPTPSSNGHQQEDKKKMTFANALKKQLPKINKKKKFVSLVYPKDDNTSSEETKSTLYSSIAPSKLNIGVKNVKKVQNGGVAVERSSEEQLKKIMNEINSNPTLQGKMEARTPVKKNPKVIVYDVEDSMSKEIFLETFCFQNKVDREKIEAAFNLKSKSQGKCHWVLQTDPTSFRQIMRSKKVFLEWARLSVREFLRPTKCYKCNRFGHISTKCPNQEACPRCGEEGHKRDDCSNDAKCINCSEAAQKFGRNIPSNHETSSQDCESYYRELKALRERTNYA
ncbi:hypothetical protein AVEN_275503-1 [Araneus ventricosus]|uniref:CCHC-type domain-containing protein n=1 Tax=Araneus ventricosus TaxID=182803 RepID=A0A4Y2QY54_ARAVE|nr:hypothetical protein AVEN_275503-1 [Araneus ventricosus]